MRIIVAGNPIDGFRFHGPYEAYQLEDLDGAVISYLIGENEWWIADLEVSLLPT